MRQGGSNAQADRRTRGRRRRRKDRWGARLRPVWYGFVIDVIILAVLFVAQRRTKVSLKVLAKRLRGEPDAAFPKPRLLGNGNIDDFEQLARELEEVRRTATTDVITGLPNQAETQKMMLLYTEVAAREGTWLSACVADLDNFKKINDTYGHAAGNEALSQLGERFRSSLDPGKPIGRWGGDEFLFLFPRVDLADAKDLAEEVRRAVEESPFCLADGTSLQLTVTLGVASGRGKGLDASLLFNAADADVIETKRVERNRVGSGRLLSAESNA
jgi:diguanylate cyclase (GGDEF)-like protein